MMRQLSEKEVVAKLTALCARAEHCSGEMAEKMRLWGIGDEAQQRIMTYLTENKYVDDARFCRAFVYDKIRYNKWGRRKVEQALYQKRIPRDISDPILDEVDDEEYVRVLQPLINSKRKSTRANSDYELKTKLIRFAMSRGFGMDIIRHCIGEPDYDDGED